MRRPASVKGRSDAAAPETCGTGNPVKSGATAPGPRGSWLLGNVAAFRRNPLQMFQEGASQYGDVVRFRLAYVVVHLLNHPLHVQHVLQSQRTGFDRRSWSAGKIRAVCGNSLLTSEGDEWKEQRRLLQSAMQPGATFDPGPAIDRAVARMLSRWRVAAEQRQSLDLTAEMLHVTFETACDAIFGFTPSDEDSDGVARSLSQVLEHTWWRMEQLVDIESVFPFLAGRRFREALAKLDQVVLRVIGQPTSSDHPGSDVLSALMRSSGVKKTAAGHRLLRDHVLTLLLSGHETTASALTWALILLARHPAVQEQLRVDSSRDSTDRCLALRVFQETIRLYPSIWIIERRVLRDDVIGGFRIPAGSTVVISPWLLHRHPQFWDDPTIFQPDRFLPGAIAAWPDFVYLPFGAGPHKCIGEHLATTVAREVIARVGAICRLTPISADLPSVQPGITMRHRQPVRVIADFF